MGTVRIGTVGVTVALGLKSVRGLVISMQVYYAFPRTLCSQVKVLGGTVAISGLQVKIGRYSGLERKEHTEV